MLEVKAKEKLNTNEQRREIVQTLVGMANRWGGTVIIGVGEDGDANIQSFSEDSEAKRDLAHTIRENTEPDLSENVRIEFEQVRDEKNVLRLDVESSRYALYKFKKGGDDGYTPYWRVEDSTREMNPEDAIEFAKFTRSTRWTRKAPHTETIDQLPRKNTPPNENISPANRVTSEIPDGVVPVFAADLLTSNKPLTFELETRVELNSIEEFRALLDSAEDVINMSSNRLAYSIQQGTRVWSGIGKTRLLEDINHIDKTVEHMLGGHPRDVSDNITHLNDIRATVSVVSNCYLGHFHVELYFKNGRIDKARAGVRLEDIPFDDSFLQDFFEEFQMSPSVYDHKQGAPDTFTILGDISLQNIEPKEMWDFSEFTNFLVADNPFYNQSEEVQRLAEKPLPSYVLENFCNIERIPFFISGGTTEIDKWEFALDKIKVWPTDYLWSPIYIEAECSSRKPKKEPKGFD